MSSQRLWHRFAMLVAATWPKLGTQGRGRKPYLQVRPQLNRMEVREMPGNLLALGLGALSWFSFATDQLPDLAHPPQSLDVAAERQVIADPYQAQGLRLNYSMPLGQPEVPPPTVASQHLPGVQPFFVSDLADPLNRLEVTLAGANPSPQAGISGSMPGGRDKLNVQLGNALAGGDVYTAPNSGRHQNLVTASPLPGTSTQYVSSLPHGGGQGDDRPLWLADRIKSNGPGRTRFITVASHSETVLMAGFFGTIHARSYGIENIDRAPQGEINDQADVLTGPTTTPYVVGRAPYSTRQTNARFIGAHLDASAISKAAATAVATWTGDGTAYGLSKLGTGQLGPREFEDVAVFIKDPETWQNLFPNEQFVTTMSPQGEWDIQFIDPSGFPYTGTATITGDVSWNGSDISGTTTTTLASWTVTLSMDQFGNGRVTASFTSDPSTGIDDAQMVQRIENGFSYSEGQFTSSEEGISIPATLVPGYEGDSVTISTSEGITLAALGVPGRGCNVDISHLPIGSLSLAAYTN